MVHWVSHAWSDDETHPILCCCWCTSILACNVVLHGSQSQRLTDAWLSHPTIHQKSIDRTVRREHLSAFTCTQIWSRFVMYLDICTTYVYPRFLTLCLCQRHGDYYRRCFSLQNLCHATVMSWTWGVRVAVDFDSIRHANDGIVVLIDFSERNNDHEVTLTLTVGDCWTQVIWRHPNTTAQWQSNFNMRVVIDSHQSGAQTVSRAPPWWLLFSLEVLKNKHVSPTPLTATL